MKVFFKNMRDFAVKLVAEMDSHNLLKDVIEVDHVCYRVETQNEYLELSRMINHHGVLLSEAMVNGRTIATFKLFDPIHLVRGMNVQVLEIPSPKPNRFYPSGFEHIEAVVNSTLEAFLGKHQNLEFSRENFEAKINRDVAYKFQNGLVKFHEQSLEKIIEAEKQE